MVAKGEEELPFPPVAASSSTWIMFASASPLDKRNRTIKRPPMNNKTDGTGRHFFDFVFIQPPFISAVWFRSSPLPATLNALSVPGIRKEVVKKVSSTKKELTAVVVF